MSRVFNKGVLGEKNLDDCINVDRYPIRVAQIMGEMNGGGVEAVVMNYYRHINRKLVQFDFIIDETSRFVPKEEIEQLGGGIYLVPSISDLPAYNRKMSELFGLGRWKIVHSHRNSLSVFPLRIASNAGIPIRIAHSHSTSGKGELLKNSAKRVLKAFANVYPTNRMACSRYAGKWLFGKSTQFDLLYNAIDIDQYLFSEASRAHVRSELGVCPDALVIGHVGRFTKQKNHQFLLKCFRQLLTIRDNAYLVLVGEGELRHWAEEWTHANGIADNVLFLGQRPDANELYRAFDAFALPSLYEGLCLVGIEAQIAGLPCYLSDTITDEVNLTGNVRFLPVNDPDTWAQELAQVVVGQRLTVCRDDFENYDICIQAPRLSDYYMRCLMEDVH